MTIYRIPGMSDPTSCRVAVYRCLTPSKPTWSIRALDGTDKGRVIAHADGVTLTACDFVVQSKQWQTIVAGLSRRGRKRNVIAWITGKIADGDVVTGDTVRVDFNFYPEHAGDGVPSGVFYRADTNAPLVAADVVTFGTSADGRHGYAVVPV